MDLFPGRRHIKLDMNENKTLRGGSIVSSNYTVYTMVLIVKFANTEIYISKYFQFKKKKEKKEKEKMTDFMTTKPTGNRTSISHSLVFIQLKLDMLSTLTKVY